MYLKYFNDERLSLARGLMRNASSVHKFGAVDSLSINTTGTVWDVNDTIYPWATWATPGVLTVPAVNVADNGNRIVVYGLDANYAEINEEFTLSSSGTVTGTKTFARVYRAYYFNNTTNVGDINIQRGGTTIARIRAGRAQTLMAVYTVPAGYTAYLMQGTATAQAGADGSGFMYVRYFEQSSFRVGHTFEIGGTGGQYFYPFATPIAIPEKSDIDVRITTRSNNGRFTAAFDMILIEDNGDGLR